MNIQRFICLLLVSCAFFGTQAGSSFWGAFGGSALGSAFGNIVTSECRPHYHKTVVVEEPLILERPVIVEKRMQVTHSQYESLKKDYEELELELAYTRKQNRKLEHHIAQLEKTVTRLERIISTL